MNIPYLKPYILVCLLTALVILSSPGKADSQFDAIAATVNDDIISYRDLENKLTFIIAILGLEDTLENRDRLRSQATQALIDETLQDQETSRRRIKVSDQKVEKSLNLMAEANGIRRADMEDYLADRNISLETLRRQVQVENKWRDFVDVYLRPRIDISDEDINAVLTYYESNQGSQEYHLSEIVLPFTSASRQQSARHQGQEIVTMIENLPSYDISTTFARVARQLSQAPSAGRDGDIGWLGHTQLDQTLRDYVQKARPGQITPLIEVDGTYTILLVRDVRIIGETLPSKLTVQKIILPYALEDQQAFRKISQGLDGKNTCFSTDITTIDESFEVIDLGTIGADEFPKHIRTALSSIEIGQVTTPLRQDEGQSFILRLCARTKAKALLPERDLVERQIEFERLEKMAQKHMHDLRRQSYIDIRLDDQG